MYVAETGTHKPGQCTNLNLCFASTAEKKEEDHDAATARRKRHLDELAPLPKKPKPSNKKAKKEQIPNSELTHKDSLAYVRQQTIKKSQEKKEAEKKPRISTTQEIIGKERKLYLGAGPTKVLIRKGKDKDRCLYCQMLFNKFDAGTEADQWVNCKSCKFPLHKKCMEHLLKCPCGAAAPRNK